MSLRLDNMRIIVLTDATDFQGNVLVEECW